MFRGIIVRRIMGVTIIEGGRGSVLMRRVRDMNGQFTRFRDWLHIRHECPFCAHEIGTDQRWACDCAGWRELCQGTNKSVDNNHHQMSLI